MAPDVSNFEEDVIVASRKRPVLVDFWAPWCGPCRILGPVLEKLAGEEASRWTLVKINTDENPELSRTYGIRGIPAVKLFVDGEVVNEFTGALPEPALRRWLEESLPSESSRQLAEAADLLERGNVPEATTLLESIVSSDPKQVVACALLAGILAFEDPPRAGLLANVAATGGPDEIRIAQAIRTLDGFRDRISGDEPFPEGAGRDEFVRALSALQDNRIEEVVLALLESIKNDRSYNDDAARKLGVAVFLLLGDKHPLTRSYRRTFDMWLD